MPIAQVSSSHLSNLQPAALNTADALTSKARVQKPNPQQMPKAGARTDAALLAQKPSEPKPTRALSSYTGIGGDIGLSGRKTALGTGGLAILSKTRLTDNLSLHTATVLFGSGTASSTYALTIGTPIKNTSGQAIVFPFIGAGVLLRNSDGLKVAALISSGVDVPISRNFTATARVNVGFPDGNPNVGLLIGVGYNFSLFGRR